MKPKKMYSKYYCDNKLKIYTDVPLSNSQYQKMIENAKPRYMNDYYNTPKFNRRKDEKSFNNLLNSYYSDYKKLKNKYNFIEEEQNEEDYPEDQNNNYVDYEEFQQKKRNIYSLFLSNDTMDLDDINFDLTDNLINNMYDGRKETLLKNTQTNNDYNLRISGKDYNPKSNQYMIKRDNIKDNPEEENKISENNNEDNIDNVVIDDNKSEEEENIPENEIFYIDEDKIKDKDDNYLILKYNKNNAEDLPLLEDIINNEYNEIYKPPIYDMPETETEKLKPEKKKNKSKKVKKVNNLKEFQDNIINNEYPLFEQLINPDFPTKFIPSSSFPLPDDENKDQFEEENDDEKKDEDDEYNDFDRSKDDIKDEGDNEYIKKDDNGENESFLKLENNQKINGREDLVMFDNIIANNFDGNYKIPTYKMPDYIKKEIEKEEEKRKKEKEEYNKNKNQNIVNISETGEHKKVNEIIRDEEEKPKVEDIINADNNIVYNPPTSIPKSENDEKKTLSQNDRYSGYNSGGFIAASTIKNESEIKSNMVENIINNDGNNKYTIPSYHSLNQEKNEEQKNEEMKNAIKEEDSVNNDNNIGKDYPVVNDMIKKDYNEEDKYGINSKKEEVKKFKESINEANNNDDDRIVVDDLNDIEDNEENYGF